MAKLRLNLDQLTVDSFDTAQPAQKKGTVFGEQCTCYTNCTCPGCPTCVVTECNQASCATCGGSCGGSCFYTECPGTNPTCNPSNFDPRECCPY
ncbi:MAG TPA: hypothetical protein VFY65_04860 [Longimicrobium sp.]|nr:hypothetical protein [Longimicrobium sp.]